jgi:hypothetical protein
MKWTIIMLPLIACSLLLAANSSPAVALNAAPLDEFSDTVNGGFTLAAFISESRNINRSNYSLKELNLVLEEKRNTQFQLGFSKQGRKINAYYIPGISEQRALVIGGVHGSELSSVEVAYNLLDRLVQGEQPYYSVIIIPSLFPDNALMAINEPAQIGGVSNIGRYTYPNAVDPNRQMPSPGKPYDEKKGHDHIGRNIEQENQLLLQLIQLFKPQRVANLHAIRNTDYGGIYADPRTDHKGIALGYSSDSSLAVNMAFLIHRQGGNVAGNKLDKKPTALYYKDPVPAPAGQFQKRNMTGSVLNAKRGSGVSLGTWGSTAVFDETDATKNRDAMRILTLEYPGYKRPSDYKTETQQLFHQKQVTLFAAAIEKYFLGRYHTEKESDGLANI